MLLLVVAGSSHSSTSTGALPRAHIRAPEPLPPVTIPAPALLPTRTMSPFPDLSGLLVSASVPSQLSVTGDCPAFENSLTRAGVGRPSVGASAGYLVALRTGGLGNQLFSVAATISLAIAAGRTPLLGPAPENNLHATIGYELSIFARLCTPTEATPEVTARIEQPGYATGNPFLYDPALAPPPAAAAPVVAVEGYWQDPRWLGTLPTAAWAELFSPPNALAARLEAEHGPLASCVAVHVRRGDYVAKADYHGLMSAAYYEAAMRRAETEGAMRPHARLLVLSDDLPWAREQTVFTRRGAIFVDGEDEVASFYLLASCARNVIVCPNSSFCWWAAFLGRAASKTARAFLPREWLHAYNGGADILKVEGFTGIAAEEVAAIG